MKALAVVSLLLLPSPTQAQSADPHWSLWTGREERVSARLLGLASASVALRDDSAAAPTNPALLAALPYSEVYAGLGGPLRREFRPTGLALLMKDSLALGGTLQRRSASTQGQVDRRLTHALTENSVQVGQRFGRLALGVSVRRAQLVLAGQSSTTTPDGLLNSEARVLDSRVGATFGAAWLGQGWTAGAAFETGMRFEGLRTAALDGRVVDRGSPVVVQRPWRLVAGASAHVSPRVMGVAQVSLRQAGRLSATARTPGVAAERGGLEGLRIGAQYAIALEHVSVVLRGGVAHLSAGGLRRAIDVRATRWAADVPASTRVSGGVGLDFPRAALDVATGTGGAWAIEARLRF